MLFVSYAALTGKISDFNKQEIKAAHTAFSIPCFT